MAQKKSTRQSKDCSLRQRAEQQLTLDQTTNPTVSSPTEANRLLHELRVHQIELEMQNQELQKAQVELTASRNRYLDLYELAPVGYLTVSEKWLILEANLSASTLLGVNRTKLIMRPLSHFILHEDTDSYYLHLKALQATAEPQCCELRMLKADGTPWWAHLQANIGPGTDDQATAYHIALSDITLLKQAAMEVERALQEKTVMLKEIHHRVKNNMNTIYSILSMQAKHFTDPIHLCMFEDCKTRILSMSLVHDALYKAADLAHIDFNAYLQGLADAIFDSFHPPNVGIVIAKEAIDLDINVAIPCGLIATELVTNSLKYAFPNRRQGYGHARAQQKNRRYLLSHGRRQRHWLPGTDRLPQPPRINGPPNRQRLDGPNQGHH